MSTKSLEHLTRQLDLIPEKSLTYPITIIGAGAVGSWVALALAKMGLEDITVYDPDTIDLANMNCQFYRLGDVGKKKVEALRQMVLDFTGVELKIIPDYYGGQIHPGIVISAVDSMDARRSVWESHKDRAPFTRAIIDPRMGAEQALLYVFSPCLGGDQLEYEKTLYSDSQAVQERCTSKATIYTANLLSGLVSKAVKDLITHRTDYLRTALWHIGNNHLIATTKPSL